jgi:hypothetical protein
MRSALLVRAARSLPPQELSVDRSQPNLGRALSLRVERRALAIAASSHSIFLWLTKAKSSDLRYHFLLSKL